MVGRIEAFCLSESHAMKINATLMVEVIIHEEPKTFDSHAGKLEGLAE